MRIRRMMESWYCHKHSPLGRSMNINININIPPQILRGAKKFKLELFFDLAPFNVCKIQTLSRRAIIPRGLIGFMRPQGFTLPRSEGAKVRHVHFPALETLNFFAIFAKFRNFRPPSGNHFFRPGGLNFGPWGGPRGPGRRKPAKSQKK